MEQRAVIADISEDKVIVQQHALGTDPATLDAVAQEGCDLYGRRAQKLSSRPAGQYVSNHLYACMARDVGGSTAPYETP